jgi:hypothetical protein
VIRRPEAQFDSDRASRRDRFVANSGTAKCAWWPFEELQKNLVESPNASESRRGGDFRHWQSRVMDQLFGQKDSPGLSDRDGRSAKELFEQAPELALADPQPRRQGLDVGVVEGPRFDQSKCPGYGIGGSVPEGQFGGCLRPTAQAWAESGFLRGGGRLKELDVFSPRRGCRAEWPTINAGRRDSDEQTAIEAMVSCFNRAVAGIVVHIHARSILQVVEAVWRISDLNDKEAASGAIRRIQIADR